MGDGADAITYSELRHIAVDLVNDMDVVIGMPQAQMRQGVFCIDVPDVNLGVGDERTMLAEVLEMQLRLDVYERKLFQRPNNRQLLSRELEGAWRALERATDIAQQQPYVGQRADLDNAMGQAWRAAEAGCREVALRSGGTGEVRWVNPRETDRTPVSVGIAEGGATLGESQRMNRIRTARGSVNTSTERGGNYGAARPVAVLLVVPDGASLRAVPFSMHLIWKAAGKHLEQYNWNDLTAGGQNEMLGSYYFELSAGDRKKYQRKKIDARSRQLSFSFE
jgi:hypothetical protein